MNRGGGQKYQRIQRMADLSEKDSKEGDLELFVEIYK